MTTPDRRRGTPPNTPKTFWQKVDRSGGRNACWPWTYYIGPTGYGMAGYHSKAMRAHRLAYQLTHGWLPSDVHVLHRCDNRACCNPKHLFTGSQSDNNIDMTVNGRQYKRLTRKQVETVKRLYQHPGARDWGFTKTSSRRWTQKALAEKFNVSRPLISMIVNEKIRLYGT